MNFQEFMTQTINEMRDRFPDTDISMQEVSKLQGESYTGMTVRPETSEIGATLNLKEFYETLGSGLSVEDVLDSIARAVDRAIRHMPQYDAQMLADYGRMRDNLTIDLVPVAGNEEKLAQIPHKNVEDMALVYRFEAESSVYGTASILVTNDKLRSKGAGYQRWASVYNLKQMSKTLLFLRDHKIESLEQLNQLAAQKIAERDELLASVQQSERRLAEIGTLKKHIINYSKTRPIYEEYRKAGYSKKFLEAHREEITIHKAAKAAFDALGVKKLPKVKELSIEYAEILDAKKRTYTEYRRTKNEAQELLLAQRNIASLYAAERKEKEPDLRKKEQSH